MFSVRWVQHGKEDKAIALENSILTDLDRVFEAAKEAFEGRRLQHISPPPDGFIVIDSDGKELRRWFTERHPHADRT